MKKTLLLTLEYPPQRGGVAHYYKQLVSHLPADKIIVVDNAQSALLYRYLWPRWIKAFFVLRHMIRTQHIQHVLVGQVLPLGPVAWLCRLFYGIPYTVMTHGMDVTVPLMSKTFWKRRLLSFILKRAQSVTTVSRYTARALQQAGVQSDSITLVYPCPYTVANASDVDLTPTIDHPLLLSVGRLVARKGFDRLIDAVQLLRTSFPTLQCVIIGSGPEQAALESQIQQLRLSKHIHIFNHVTDQELVHWYQRCTVFVLPSRTLSNGDCEGFGIVFVEAAIAGKPVVAGRSGGIPDAVIDGETGLLVDPNNPQAIAQACKDLLIDPIKAQTLGQAGRVRVLRDFQWQEQANRLQQLL